MFSLPDFKLLTIDLTKFDLPKIDLSKLELPKIDFAKFDLPSVDTSKLTDAVRDAGYVVVGLGATLVERARDLLDNAA